MTERDVPGFEGLYTVRADGQIWSVRSGRPLTPFAGRRGHFAVAVSVNDKRSSVMVDISVLEAFHGPCPSSDYEAFHKNGDLADNRIENLEWRIAKTEREMFEERRSKWTWSEKALSGRDVPGFEGRYRVTEDGEVWSLGKRQPHGVWTTQKGYPCVTLWNGEGLKHIPMHTLLLTVFVGPRPSPAHQGCHNNGVKTDHRLSNLRWDTVKNNHLDKKAHGTEQVGENHGSHKLTAAQVFEMRASSETHVYWAKKFNVDPMTVAYARNNTNWRHLNRGDES